MPDGKKSLTEFNPEDIRVSPGKSRDADLSFGSLLGVAGGLLAPQIDYVKDVYNAILEPSVKFGKGVSQVTSGENIPAGALNVLNSIGELAGAVVISPVTLSIKHGVPEGTVQDTMLDGLNNIFGIPTYVRSRVQEGVELVGVKPEDEIDFVSKVTGTSPEKVKEFNEALETTADLAAFATIPALKGGVKAVLNKIPKKPLKVNIDPYVEPKTLPEGTKNFKATEIGDITKTLTKEESIQLGELKLGRDELSNERIYLQDKVKSNRDSLRDTKGKTGKEVIEKKKALLKDNAESIQRIKEIDEIVEYRNKEIDSFMQGEVKGIKGLLPERGTSVPLEDVSGVNKPSNINFAVATEPGAKTTTKMTTDKVLGVKRTIEIKKQETEVKPVESKKIETKIEKPVEQVKDYKTFEDLVKEEDSKQITKFVQKELGKEGFEKLNGQITNEIKDIPIEEQGRYIESKWLAEAQKIVEAKSPQDFINKIEAEGLRVDKVKSVQMGGKEMISVTNPKTNFSRYLEVDKIGTEIQRFKTEEALQRKDKPSGLSSSTQLGMGIDPTQLTDIAKYGAELTAKGYKSFSKWADEMKKTYGAEISSQLIKIWDMSKTVAKEQKAEQDKLIKDVTFKTDKTSLSPKEKIQTTVQETKFVKELQDFIRDEKIPIEMQNEILKLVKANQDKFTTTNLGFFRRKLLDRGTNLTKRYGAAGGELFQRGLKGGAYHKQLLETAYNKHLNRISEIANDKPLAFKKDISPEVIKALEDRANAEKYLTTPEAREVYKLTSGLYDSFKTELEKAGVKTREDYFTHRILVDEVDRILRDDILNKDPKDIGKGSVNDYYSAESSYTKERKRAEMDLMSDDLMAVLQNYTYSISKHLGFKEVVDYYKNGFLDELNKNPILKTRTDLSYVKEHLKGVLYPEIANSKTAKFITNRRNNLYQALLWNNFKASFQNLGQKFLTQFFISDGARNLTNSIYRNQGLITGKLSEAMAEVKRGGMAHYLEIGSEGMKGSKAEKVDFFRKSERGNWTYSELAGIINRAMKLTDKPIKSMQDLNKILSDKGNFDKVVREARDLSSKTQYNPEATFRPTAYDKWAVRTFAMFTRYPLGTMDLFAKTLGKSLEGAEGLRAQTILRKGLTDAENIKPVEFLRATEHYRKSLENVLKQAEKEGYDFKNVPKEKINQYVDFLKKKEQQMNSVLQKLEPMDKKKNAKVWAKYIGYSAVVSFTYKMVQAQLWEALGITDNKKKTVGQHLTNVIMDVSPLPFYRFNPQEVVNVPLIPNTEFMLYGNWNLKGGVRSLLDYTLNTTPYTNIINQSLQRVTGETAGGLLLKRSSNSLPSL